MRDTGANPPAATGRMSATGITGTAATIGAASPVPIAADGMKMKVVDRLPAMTAGRTATIRARCGPAITAAMKKRKAAPIPSGTAANAAMADNTAAKIMAATMAAAITVVASMAAASTVAGATAAAGMANGIMVADGPALIAPVLM